MRSARDTQPPQRPRMLLPYQRRSTNWDATADAEAEAQLLRGLVTFRDRVGRGPCGKQPPLNTPAASFNLEFARELQSLHLNVAAAANSFDHHSDEGKAAKSPSTPPAADAVMDVSGDMLALAADGQLRQTLRWTRQQQSAAAAAAAATNPSLFGGRLDGYFFLRAPANQFAAASRADDRVTDDGASSQSPGSRSRRLTYRKSRNGPRTQPDDAIELLLKSRTPTILQGSGGGGWVQPHNVAPVTPPPAALVLSVSIVRTKSGTGERVVTRGVSAATAAEVGPVRSPAVPATLEASHPPTPVLSPAAETRESSGGRETPFFSARGDKPAKKKNGRKRRRKGTGLEMLDNIDAGPSPTLSRPSPPLVLSLVSTEDRTRTSITTKTYTAANMTKTRSAMSPVDDSGTPTAFGKSRGRSCLSHGDSELQRVGSWQGHSIGSVSGPAMPHISHENSEQLRGAAQQHQQHLCLQSQPAQSAGSPTESSTHAEPPDDRPAHVLLPVSDQYRIAHEMARAANMNSQFEAWLRLGRDPDEFFSCRTTTGSYSYFPRLPRYDRGLEPFQPRASAAAASQFNPTVRQQFYSRRKLTPAYLAYGGKDPDDYLPPPAVFRLRGGQSKR